MNIPHSLLEAIRDGRTILFLGAGASMGASSKENLSPPSGYELGVLLSDKFLGGEDKDKSLSTIAEYCISDTDIVTVQSFITSIFSQFEPAEFHCLIPTFKWHTIATTNYDLIIERAYSKATKPIQQIIPFIKNTQRINTELRKEETIPYIKLHGCISHYEEPDLPLILTIDQYVTHKKNRDKLFTRLKDQAGEFPVVFVGYRIEDSDIRQILLEFIEEGTSRPRYYVVTPNPSERDIKLWESKKITALNGTMESFINSINEALDFSLRAVHLPEREHRIAKNFTSNEKQLSSETLAFLNTDATYITSDLPTESTSPDAFYKGYSYGWDSIQKSYDCKRDIVDTILTDVIITDEVDRPSIVDLYVLKGHAGSGKTIILKRLAWDSSIEFGKLCLYFESSNYIDIDALFEILGNVDERVYLFIDQASDHVSDINTLVIKARQRSERLTIIIAERTNEWNIDCTSLNPYVDEVYDVKYLKHLEISDLINKLEKYNSLGLLKPMSPEERIQAFEKKAGRQLLVALHEATLGKPFEEIIRSEFRNIEPTAARNIYQTVSVLNRLQVPVRAGLIKRIHNVSFADFKERFFAPLESVVYTRFNKSTRDYEYSARHPWIAEIIFETTLRKPEERLDLYLKILDALDIGYDSDRTAYRRILQARALTRLFADPKMVRAIYDKAKIINIRDPYYHQQKAIYEMQRDNPNYELAYEELKHAEELSPRDRSIKHSLAERLELLRAKTAKTDIENIKHTNNAKMIAESLASNGSESSYGYHTLTKIYLERLERQLNIDPDNDSVLSTLVKEAEETIKNALQAFPDDDYILSSEARFAELINQDKRAVEALSRAFRVNPMSAFLARGLARLYVLRGEYSEAESILKTCLDGIPADKSVNSALARIYSDYYLDKGAEAEYHWRRSFTEGDANHFNQFWYARQLYINDKKDEAIERFKELKNIRLSPDLKQNVKGPILNANGEKAVFRGVVEKREATYGFISQELSKHSVFLHRNNVSSKDWEKIVKGSELTFSIGFTYQGLSAMNVFIME